ncbi:unnamed protein product [Trifolium pratense]|uniref:Uncharacterized protein n=1 Tax=Trifolium pratense TaxID=57577 RepID=A0ACB0K526_TRIPR|nr:unnamed protein product [Trifolium pratense]
MVKIIKFIYVMIIFVSLFLIAKNVDAQPRTPGIKCLKAIDCPRDFCPANMVVICGFGECACVQYIIPKEMLPPKDICVSTMLIVLLIYARLLCKRSAFLEIVHVLQIHCQSQNQ